MLHRLKNPIPPTNKSRVRNVTRSKTFLRLLDVRLNRAHAAIHSMRDFFSDESGAESAHDLKLTRGEWFHIFNLSKSLPGVRPGRQRDLKVGRNPTGEA